VKKSRKGDNADDLLTEKERTLRYLGKPRKKKREKKGKAGEQPFCLLFIFQKGKRALHFTVWTN